MITYPGCQLYLITPPDFSAAGGLAAFAALLEAALDAGPVACVQLRLKNLDDDAIREAANVLAPIAQSRDIAFLMNDRPDLAAETGCDGVHIGQDDASYEDARQIVGNDATVGVTCHDSRHLAMVAGDAGADYIAFGAFYDTATKSPKTRASLDLLSWWRDITTVPAVAIGGITAQNCAPIIEAGADFIAVSSGVWSYEGGPAAAIRDFGDMIARHQP